jgi:hypothetical protein
MNHTLLPVAVIVGFALSACAIAPRMVRIPVPFNAEQARDQVMPGPNSIIGSALVRQQGGGVVTCAGSFVALIPATEYAKHRMTAVYGSSTLLRDSQATAVQFEPDPPEYTAAVRATRCDAQGAFAFDRVADGEFYIGTRVAWTVGRSSQGGTLMQLVRVTGGQQVNVVITP